MSSVPTGPLGGNHSNGDHLPSLVDEVERLVDTYSLADVLEALSEMANGKAHHLATAWQDERGGALWGKVAEVLDQVRAALPEGV